MPVHNAEQFVTAAITSIISQTYTNWELIVVNDGSTDRSRQISASLAAKDKRIRLISYRHNQGESTAANIGFSHAKGVYIARMDADDIAHPSRLDKQVAFLEKHPQYVVVGTQAFVIDEADVIIGSKTFPKTHQAIYHQYGVLHPMLHPSIMVRRSLLPDPNILWANQAEPNDDYLTLFQLLRQGKFYNLPAKLMYYRMHQRNKSLQQVKQKFINSLKIRYQAVRKFDYPLTTKMVTASIAQSVVVLLLPEWLVVGMFLWLKGMKSFDQAFPKVAELKTALNRMQELVPQPSYLVPMLVTLTIHTLLFKKTS